MTTRKFPARVSTGRINEGQSGSEVWAGSAAAQVTTAENIKGILAKTIPVDYVVCDPENPRKLDLTQEQIAKISATHPLDRSKIKIDESTDWIEDYVLSVCESYDISGKAAIDLESLVTFAAALKSADRLLHPIVVWRNESTFHLIAGERRLLAHIILGEKYIAARIVENSYTRNEIDVLQWEENVHRVDMSLWERVDHIKRLVEAGEGTDKTSVTKLSKIIGKSRADCQRYLVILRFPGTLLLNAIASGKIKDLKTAAALAQLSPDQLEKKLSVDAKNKDNLKPPAIKFSNKKSVPQFGLLLKAAANQLKLEDLIAGIDLTSPTGINTAIELLIQELEVNNGG